MKHRDSATVELLTGEAGASLLRLERTLRGDPGGAPPRVGGRAVLARFHHFEARPEGALMNSLFLEFLI